MPHIIIYKGLIMGCLIITLYFSKGVKRIFKIHICLLYC